MKEIRRELRWSRIPRGLIWNDPKKLLLYKSIKKVYPYTMVKYTGLCQCFDIIQDIDRRKIPGAIVETGCWNGGCGALLAYYSKRNGSHRQVWLFDSFKGLPEFSPADKEQAEMKNVPVKEENEKELKSSGWLVASPAQVKEICSKMEVESQVHIVEGWFQDTVPQSIKDIGKIALLRLDGDLYESTKYCLEQFYDHVVPGGVIVIDDYQNWEGCRKALYEFFYKRGISSYIKEYPFGGRVYFMKQ